MNSRITVLVCPAAETGLVLSVSVNRCEKIQMSYTKARENQHSIWVGLQFASALSHMMFQEICFYFTAWELEKKICLGKKERGGKRGSQGVGWVGRSLRLAEPGVPSHLMPTPPSSAPSHPDTALPLTCPLWHDPTWPALHKQERSL